MKVDQSSYDPNVNFKYNNILKTLYKKGKLPTVKYDIYGKELTKNTVSLEHIVPHSKGGPTKTSNLALADKYENNRRGDLPIIGFTTIKNIKRYFSQFINIKVKHNGIIFDGNKYIKDVKQTLSQLDIIV